MMIKVIFALLVIGFLVTPALADSDNSKNNMNKQEKNNSKNGFQAFGQDFNKALSDFGKAGKEFYEMDFGALIYNEIVSLDKKIKNIDNNQIRHEFSIQTGKAMDVILGEGSFEERIDGVNSILSGLSNAIQNKTSDDELDSELGQELLDDTNKIVELNEQTIKKTLIMPKNNSAKSKFHTKWIAITLPGYEADIISKDLKMRGYDLTSTLFENKDGKTISALRITPPAFGEVKPDEIKISSTKICTEDKVTVLKINGTPACVKPSTAEKLMARGWAISY